MEWQSLSDRERKLIQWGGLIVGLCLIYLLIANPLFSWRENARQDAANAARNYELVREAASQRVVEDAASSVDTSVPIRIVLSQTANSLNVQLSAYNPLPDGRVTASAQAVSASQLFALITSLQEEHGVYVESGDIARDAESPELVRAQLTFARGAGG